MARITIEQVYEAVQAVNARLDKMNGKIEEHDRQLRAHEVKLAELDVEQKHQVQDADFARLDVEQKHQSVNWDRVISFVIMLLQFIALAGMNRLIAK